MKEYADHMIIEVSPMARPGTDWGETRYFIKVDTDPNYAGDDLDTPIELSWGDHVGDNKPIQMEPDDAEEIAHAILRAVEIRRAVNSGLPIPCRPDPEASAAGVSPSDA